MDYIVKICGNCDYFEKTEVSYGICGLVKGCIGKNTTFYSRCKDFKHETRTEKEAHKHFFKEV